MSEGTIRALGWIAITGGVLNIGSDLLIVSQPMPADNEGIEFLKIMPIENVRLGVILGLFSLGSWLLVLPSIARGLERASTVERWLAVASFAVFVIGCLTFHSLFWPAAIAIQATAGTENVETVLEGLGGAMLAYQAIIISSLVILTLTLAIAIFRKRADYPWWVLLTSPIVTILAFGGFIEFIPAPYGDYVGATVLTFLSTVFVASLTLARRLRAASDQ